jgi:hypothetical protein
VEVVHRQPRADAVRLAERAGGKAGHMALPK